MFSTVQTLFRFIALTEEAVNNTSGIQVYSSAPIKGTPDTGRMCLNIVKPAMSMAECTIVLMPFTWSSMNPKMVKSV